MFKNTNRVILVASIILCAIIIALFSPFLGLATIAGLIILFFTLKNPLNGVIFLAVYLPLETFLLKFVSGSIGTLVKIFSDGLVVFIFIYVLFLALKKNKKIHWPKNLLNWLIAAFILIWLISTLVNQVEIMTAFSGLRQLLRYVLIFYSLILLGVENKFIKKFLIVCFSIFALQSALGLMQLILPDSFSYFLVPSATQTSYGSIISETGNIGWDITQRISGTFGRYDKLGIFLSFFLAIGLSLFYTFKNKDKNIKEILFFLLAIGSLALIFTFSRLSWLGFIVALILIGWLWQKDKKIKTIFLSGLAILIIYLFGFLIISGFKISSYEENQSQFNLATRILQTFSKYELQNSYYGFGRIFFWINTPKVVVASSPIVGVGPGLYGSGTATSLQNRQVYNRLGLPFGIQDNMGQIDNNWLSLWGEYGTLGLITFILIFVSLFFQSKKIYQQINEPLIKGLALGFMALCIIFPLQAFFGPYFEVRTIAFYFWAVAGIIIGYKK